MPDRGGIEGGGVASDIYKQIEGSIPNVADTNQESAPRKRDIGDFNQSPSIRALSGTKGCKYHGVGGSADDAVSERDSDDEYILGSIRRAKCTTKVGRKESKSGLEGSSALVLPSK